MSLFAVGEILEELRLDVSESDMDKLEDKFEDKFGILGMSYCEELEKEWEKDPAKIKDLIYNVVSKSKSDQELQEEEKLICPMQKKRKRKMLEVMQ